MIKVMNSKSASASASSNVDDNKIKRREYYLKNIKFNKKYNGKKGTTYYDKKKGVDLKKKAIDLEYGRINEPIVLKKIKEKFNLDNIYKRHKKYELIDFWIGDKNDMEKTDIEIVDDIIEVE